jgi:hypothetical protein
MANPRFFRSCSTRLPRSGLVQVPLCAVAIYVLFGAKSQGYSALTSCLKEHNFCRIVEPLGHQFQGGLTCLICYSLVGTRSRDTN